VVDAGLPAVMDFLPNAGALAMTSEAIREWIGSAVYRLQGGFDVGANLFATP
jgi:hypothetical protein